MLRRLHVKADLLIAAGPTTITVKEDAGQQLVIRLSELRAVADLKIGKFKAYRLLRRCSRLLDQSIVIFVAGEHWLSCRNGRLSVKDYSLTLKAFFTL